MPQPIICLDEEVCYFAERFRSVFSKPQYQYFVTVLLGLMECNGKRTLSGVLSQVGQPPSLSGLSRFFAEARGCRRHWWPSGWSIVARRCSRRWKPNVSSNGNASSSVEAAPNNPS